MDERSLQRKFGGAVRKRRLASGHSQDTFADAIGMHRAYFSSIERGERNITLQTMRRVAEGLGITIASLMSDAGL